MGFGSPTGKAVLKSRNPRIGTRATTLRFNSFPGAHRRALKMAKGHGGEKRLSDVIERPVEG